MGKTTEIECKFLVARMPDLDEAEATPVRQGYLTLPSDSIEIRLRQKGDKLLMTLKSGAGLMREERETTISQAQFDIFWSATGGRRIEKTRWTGRLSSGLTYELDVFEGSHAPLRLVEVEFDSRVKAEAFIPPAWFGREVTEDRAYSNRVMAISGLPADMLRDPA